MSTECVVLCHWEYYDYQQHRFVSENEPGTECRASMTEKTVTVWLPHGAKIRLRNNTSKRWFYLYGSHERLNRTKIKIELLP